MSGSNSRSVSRGRSRTRKRGPSKRMSTSRPAKRLKFKSKSRSKSRPRGASRSKNEETHSSAGQKSVYIKKNKGKDTAPALVMYSSTALRVDANSGQQAVNVLIQKGGVADWLTTSSTQPDTNPSGWFNFNPNQNITGGTTFTAGTVSTDTMKHMHDKIVLHITNFSNLALYQKLYVVRCTKPTSADFINQWNDGLVRQGLGFVEATYPAGGVDSVGTRGYLSSQTVDLEPSISRQLGQFWKIERVINVPLAAASTENIYLTVESNITHTKEYVQKMSDEGNVFIAGSYQVVAVTFAQCVADVTVPASPLATLGGVAFGCVATCQTALQVGSYKKRTKATLGVYRITHALSNANLAIIDANDDVDPETNV